MKHRYVVMLAAALLCSFRASAPAQAADGSETSSESGAGGLSFAANPSIRIEQQDVLVGPDKVSVTYTVRNTAGSQQSIHISFLLPDLEAGAVADGEIALGSALPHNFVQFSTLVDGQPISLQAEQRASALGFDVTGLLSASGLPLFPLADGFPEKLEALPAAQRLDLLERGILKDDGTTLTPAWTLKTVAAWRQTFAADQTITIQHSYRPIAGLSQYRAETVSALGKRACLTAAQENIIAKLPAEGAAAPTLTSVTYSATPNVDGLGPVRRFRLIVEVRDPVTVVASCREGLKRTGPMQLEWAASDYIPDEDFMVLFAR